jgi:elongation factor P--beta-lysine ligase
VDVRVYTEFSAARTPMPTRRGIALGIDQLPALVAALQAAEAMALELGMIGGAT